MADISTLKIIYYVALIVFLALPIVAGLLVHRIGAPGARSYIVGIICSISVFILASIVSTFLRLVPFFQTGTQAAQTVASVAVTVITAVLQVVGLRWYMHVFLKRNTYAVFYGAGIGFAFVHMIMNGVLTIFSKVGIIGMLQDGESIESLTQRDVGMGELAKLVTNTTVFNEIVYIVSIIMLFFIVMALAVILGHAVRNEKKYFWASMAVWTVLSLMFAFMRNLPVPVQLATDILLIAISIFLMFWSSKKYGLSVQKPGEDYYRGPLNRHE